MHIFEVHSNESACRKSGRLGPDQVIEVVSLTFIVVTIFTLTDVFLLNTPPPREMDDIQAESPPPKQVN